MTMKLYLDKNVLEATRERLDVIFSEFERICLSFSGGKDSGVMLNLSIEAARKHNKLPLHVLFIDLEAQYQHTIDYVREMLEKPEVKPYWVCLPLHLRNSVSQYQPHWLCWDPDKKDIWVRNLPEKCISEVNFFPFFKKGMEFEEFVPLFTEWFSQEQKTASIVAIRSDESLNRFRTIASTKKILYKDYQWTTKLFPKSNKEIYSVYPIYDWRTEDLWRANAKLNYPYNKIYDLMHLAGVKLHQMRLCQPYGDDQRKGLYLFKILEPKTWSKVVARVEGANFGNRYSESQQITLGHLKIPLPEGHTFESYAKLLLSTMPPYLQEHYENKINKFATWWDKKGGIKTIPDSANKQEEAAKKAPSWRRIVKTIIKNDYWCKGLSFSQTKREMERQMELIKKYKKLL